MLQNLFLKHFSESKNDLDSSLILDSSEKKLFYYYGKLYLFKNEFKTSIYYYSKAISKDQLYAPAYDERAVAKGLIGDYFGAVQDEDIAINLDSSQDIYFTDRGFAKLQLKDYKGAIQDFSSSLGINPNHKAFSNRGFAYYCIELTSKAIEDYTKALEIDSQDAEIFYRRALAYQKLNKMDKACADLKKSKDLGYLPASKNSDVRPCE